jgi:hypothetical protein
VKFAELMEKINYHEHERELLDRLERFLEAARRPRPARTTGRVTEPASRKQLEILANLGIYPKWHATRYEAEEMISNYKLILGSVNRKP